MYHCSVFSSKERDAAADQKKKPGGFFMQQQEIKALLSDMSLEEKIGELFQLPSYFFNGDMVTGPAEIGRAHV